MQLSIQPTKIENAFTIALPTNFEDFRGRFVELYNEKLYSKAIENATGTPVNFVQDNVSTSTKNVLRGFHGDTSTWKLLTCLVGKLYVVILDMRKSSTTYEEHEAFTLSASNKKQLLVPPNVAVAHLVTSDIALLHYKQSTYYDAGDPQYTVAWNSYGIYWPIKTPTLSERDAYA